VVSRTSWNEFNKENNGVQSGIRLAVRAVVQPHQLPRCPDEQMNRSSDHYYSSTHIAHFLKKSTLMRYKKKILRPCSLHQSKNRNKSAITTTMATLACVPNYFLVLWVALNFLSACWPSNSGPSGPERKIPAPRRGRCEKTKNLQILYHQSIHTTLHNTTRCKTYYLGVLIVFSFLVVSQFSTSRLLIYQLSAAFSYLVANHVLFLATFYNPKETLR